MLEVTTHIYSASIVNTNPALMLLEMETSPFNRYI
jgi:hypothetical protein